MRLKREALCLKCSYVQNVLSQFLLLTICYIQQKHESCWGQTGIFFQPNLYFLCILCFQMLHEGKVQELQFLSTGNRKANNDQPIFLSKVYSCNIPSMRIVTVQCQNNELFIWLHRRAKILENLHRTHFFWIHPAIQ